jgi:beta-galactosidase beta subunit
VETARKKHELSLLRDIELAGAKSWQAKAWMAERIYNHAIPSARLQVSQDVTHGISGNLASLLAGIAGRKKITATPEKRQIESGHNYIDIQPVTTKPENHLSNNKYCINKTNSVEQQQDTQAKTPKVRHKRMRQRKPRAESLAKYPPTTTPPADPPATI